MFDIRYNGLRIEPTLAATRELIQEGKDLYDVVEILEKGYPGARRKPGMIERCLRKGKKEFKVVMAKTEIRHPDKEREEVWRLIYIGKYTYKKGRRK